MTDVAPIMSPIGRIRLYWEFSRPFTLLPPALGMLSGGVTALGAHPPSSLSWTLVYSLAVGTLMAVVLNILSPELGALPSLLACRHWKRVANIFA